MAHSREGILQQILSILFPQRCAHCRAYGEELCPECRGQLRPVGPRRCRRCGKPSLYDVPDCPECRHRRLHFNTAGAAFRFEGPARSLVHGLKYSGQRRLAELMAELTMTCGRKALTQLSRGATLSYVPVSRSRQFSRGYNQAELYARALARRLEAPLAAMLVKRHPTRPQNRLSFDERGKNLGNSFTVRGGYVAATKKVILVDDVYTTGATASECSRVLKYNLGVVVDIWTFARTVKN